jgi:hypothetical protein
MKAKELIKILKSYDPESEVSIVHWNEGATVNSVEMVADNNGPSIYAAGWETPPETEADLKHAAWEAERGEVWDATGV